MDRIFVSYHFTEPSHAMLDIIQQIVSSFGIAFETGVDLGGRELKEEIDNRIDRADGLIALMTRDIATLPNGFSPTDYVKYEFQRGRDRRIPCIAVVESEVQGPAWDVNSERIDYDPNAPVRAVMKIVRTVARWRRDAPRLLHVKLAPRDVFATFTDQATCEYRLRRDDKVGEWQKGSLDQQPGDWYVYLRKPQDNSFQIRVACNGQRWSSGYSPEVPVADLKREP